MAMSYICILDVLARNILDLGHLTYLERLDSSGGAATHCVRTQVWYVGFQASCALSSCS
jgi:hypothetical protein